MFISASRKSQCITFFLMKNKQLDKVLEKSDDRSCVIEEIDYIASSDEWQKDKSCHGEKRVFSCSV